MNTSHPQSFASGFAPSFPGRYDGGFSGLQADGLGFSSVFNNPSLMQQQTGALPSAGASSFATSYGQRQGQQQAAFRQQPSSRGAESLHDIAAIQASLEEQLAAMRLQSSRSQPRQPDMQSDYSNYAAQPYPAYPHQQQQQQQQQQHHYLQQQQQLLQQQLASRQQQIDLTRMQVLQQQSQQAQHRQQVAAQQRFLLSQLQGANEHDAPHASLMAQPPFVAASAQEQRQAAQASIQASLRQRQAQQLHPSMSFDSGASSPDSYGPDAGMPSFQQQQQFGFARPAARSGESQGRVPPEQRSWRSNAGHVGAERMPTPPFARGASPASSLPSRHNGRPSSGTTDSILSARSRTMTPSIVIDDSASEGSRAFSDGDLAEGDQTPETSEEDLDVNTPVGKALPAQPAVRAGGAPAGKYGSVGRAATAPVIQAPKAIPRAISLASAPPNRAFARDAKFGQAQNGSVINNHGLTLPPVPPRRQPKGQPTEFAHINFQARMNSRLRKDAMSKLCASPRAASFGGNGLSFGSRLSSSGSVTAA